MALSDKGGEERKWGCNAIVKEEDNRHQKIVSDHELYIFPR
jgi:hypothetical protein